MSSNLAMISYIGQQKQSNKRNIHKLNFIRIKDFCESNDTIKRVLRQRLGDNLKIVHLIIVTRIKKSYNLTK